jgi:hypothetical protein
MVSRGNQPELAAPDRQSSDYDLELQHMTTEQAHPGQVIRVLLCVNGKPATEEPGERLGVGTAAEWERRRAEMDGRPPVPEVPRFHAEGQGQGNGTAETPQRPKPPDFIA